MYRNPYWDTGLHQAVLKLYILLMDFLEHFSAPDLHLQRFTTHLFAIKTVRKSSQRTNLRGNTGKRFSANLQNPKIERDSTYYVSICGKLTLPMELCSLQRNTHLIPSLIVHKLQETAMTLVQVNSSLRF